MEGISIPPVEVIKILIDGGGTGIALVCLFLLYKKDQATNKLIGNHLKSETKSKLKWAVALGKFSVLIKHYFKTNGIKKK